VSSAVIGLQINDIGPQKQGDLSCFLKGNCSRRDAILQLAWLNESRATIGDIVVHGAQLKAIYGHH